MEETKKGESMTSFTEVSIEEAALFWLQSLGWRVSHGADIAPDAPGAERSDYREVVLVQRLRDALARLNPDLPEDALEDAFRRLTHPEGATLEARNRAFHRMLVDGVTVEYRRPDGTIAGAQVRVLDFDDPENNDWLAVSQFTVAEGRSVRRPDIVLFVNGLPLAIVELKNPADEEATIWTAFNQLQTYKAELPTLFAFNELLVVSDGLEARLGTLTAGREWFKPWRTVAGVRLEDEAAPQLEVLLKGVFDRRYFLELLRDFVVFEDDGSGRLNKKVAGYHQFHAVRVAVPETLRASRYPSARIGEESGQYEAGRKPGGAPGDRRIGVIWHTQAQGRASRWCFMPVALFVSRPWGTLRWSSSPTATTWTTSSSACSPAARTYSGSRPCRPRAALTSASCFSELRAGLFSRRSRSSSPRRRATGTPCCPTARTSW